MCVCVCEVVQEGPRGRRDREGGGRRVDDVREHTANHTIALCIL